MTDPRDSPWMLRADAQNVIDTAAAAQAKAEQERDALQVRVDELTRSLTETQRKYLDLMARLDAVSLNSIIVS